LKNAQRLNLLKKSGARGHLNIGQARSRPANATQSRDQLRTPALDSLAAGHWNDVHSQQYSQKQQGQFESILNLNTNDDYAHYNTCNTWATQTENPDNDDYQNDYNPLIAAKKEYKEYSDSCSRTWDIVKRQNLQHPGRQPQLKIVPAKSGAGRE